MPEKEWYRVGEVLRCSADANPNPSFVWKEATSVTQHHGPTFTIPESMTQNEDQRIDIVCTANNSEGTDSKSIRLEIHGTLIVLYHERIHELFRLRNKYHVNSLCQTPYNASICIIKYGRNHVFIL